MTTQIDSLQLKIQTQLLQAMFLKNMTFLKTHMPAIYNFYQSYSVNSTQLAIDDSGAVNLLTNNQFFYQEDPQTSSIKQVQAFLKKPVCFDYSIVSSSKKTLYEHQRVNNEIVQQREKELGVAVPYALNNGEQINCIAFIGVGLGHHIEYLFNQYQIRSMLIYEPSADVFFSMLHSVDISMWYQKCQQLGGKLTFKVGGVEQEFINDIYRFLKNEGSFNLVQMFLYRHYFSDKTTDALKLLNELEYRFKSGWGFCEDEIIGISHTLENIQKNNAPILLNKAKLNKKELPVFIIGNGPSLDENLAYIKENQSNVIIISSGTSLKPLLNYGIVPDIHVEQERPKSIYKWVKKIGHEEALKNIPLVCLNTVYPGILDLFKKAYVVMKYSDAGTSLLSEYISHEFADLLYCNPTVTNASTAASVGMGFNQLYLFGVDYGFASEDEHHAKGSIYQDLKSYKMSGEFKVAANFGGQVFTNRIFDSSRGVLEILLGQNPDVRCINASDGAAVKHATACRFNQLPDFPRIENKQAVLDNYLSAAFQPIDQQQSLEQAFASILPNFVEYIQYLKDCLNHITSKVELTAAFAEQYNFVHHHNSERCRVLFMKFFSGSLNYLQANIMHNVSKYKDKSSQLTYIHFCIEKMNAHLQFLLDDVSTHYNQPARA